MTIKSFSDKDIEDFFISGNVKKGIGWSSISKIAKRKLDILHYAADIKDLRAMPGNRLEILKGNLKGYYSIRINDQWRIIFKWFESGADNVSIIDYH
ncbi:MAG: type II toxin-antitoxin system RelE/ParE family toxin [Actinomycetota bacterium]